MNEHGVHSPFVFDLLNDVIYNKTDYYFYRGIENVREELLKSKIIIDFQEGKSHVKRKVSILTKQYEIPVKYGQLLFRLINRFQPHRVIEVGSMMGISTSYIAAANSKIKVLNIQKDRHTAEVAKENFRKLRLKNIETVIADVDNVLPEILSKSGPSDFVFINKNLKHENILSYFYQCLEKADESSVFVICDIYKTAQMKECWTQIKNDNRVTVTIDLFFIGIVFFRKEQVKQHFVIKF